MKTSTEDQLYVPLCRLKPFLAHSTAGIWTLNWSLTAADVVGYTKRSLSKVEDRPVGINILFVAAAPDDEPVS